MTLNYEIFHEDGGRSRDETIDAAAPTLCTRGLCVNAAEEVGVCAPHQQREYDERTPVRTFL